MAILRWLRDLAVCLLVMAGTVAFGFILYGITMVARAAISGG